MLSSLNVSRRKLKQVFVSRSGAIDLASVMVGIVVIGLIGGVIATTLFAIIPWSQDNRARGQLDSVVTAQGAYLGLNDIQTYGVKSDLVAEGVLSANTPVIVGIAVIDPDGAGPAGVLDNASYDSHYIAISKSDSGSYFWITDRVSEPQSAVSEAAAKTAAEASFPPLENPKTVDSWVYDGVL